MKRFALAFAAIALVACSGGTVVDRPDATLSWPSHRQQFTVPDGGLGIVSNNNSDSLSLLDLASASTIGQVQVGIDPIANDGPHHVAIDAHAGRVYVALSYPPPGVPSGPHAGHGASTQPGWVQMLALDDFRELGRAPIATNPGEIILTPDRTRVIVTHFDLQRAIDAIRDGLPMTDAYASMWVLDATDLHRIASPDICIAPHGAAITADSNRAFVACAGQDSLAIVHLDDPNLRTELIPVGPGPGSVPNQVYGPYSVLITHDQQYALIGDLEGKDLRVFNIATNQFEAQHALMLRAATYFGTESADGTMLYFPTQSPDQIVRIRRSDFAIDAVATVPGDQCQLPHEISRGPDGRYYLVCEAVRNSDGSPGLRTQPSHVVTFDPNTLTIDHVFPVGAYPDRIVFAPESGPR
jgi:DNA-binding beta-propeller fold protein YncE